MEKKQVYLSQQKIERAIFEGKYPTKIIKIPPLTLILVVNDRFHMPNSVEDWFTFFSNAAFIPGLPDSRLFLREVPFSFFERLIQEYTALHNNWMSSVLIHMNAIVESSRSQMAWRVTNKVDPTKVLPLGDRLNTAQYYWVVYNTIQDKKDRATMIADLFEAAKPWLNVELWSRMEEEKEGGSGRQNILYEEQIREFEDKLSQQQPITDTDDISMETK